MRVEFFFIFYFLNSLFLNKQESLFILALVTNPFVYDKLKFYENSKQKIFNSLIQNAQSAFEFMITYSYKCLTKDFKLNLISTLSKKLIMRLKYLIN